MIVETSVVDEDNPIWKSSSQISNHSVRGRPFHIQVYRHHKLSEELETEIMDNETYKLDILKLEDVFQETRNQYLSIAREMIGDKLLITDFYFSAAIDQGIRLMDGMLPMLEQRNLTCAAALLRMQIDTYLRTYAAFIADDLDAFMDGYIAGEIIDKFKDDRGNKMKDWYLKERLSEHFRNIDADYDLASGFVHFSHNAFQMIARTHDVLTTRFSGRHSTICR